MKQSKQAERTFVIVKVAVSAAPYVIDQPYDYLVPDALTEGAVPGVRVRIPFGRGNRETEGLIWERGRGEMREGLKAVRAILDAEPVLSTEQMMLARWMQERYFCTLYEAVKVILPVGLWYRTRNVWCIVPELQNMREMAEIQCAGIPNAAKILEVLYASGDGVSEDVLKRVCGKEVSVALSLMEGLDVVRVETEIKRKIAEKNKRMIELNPSVTHMTHQSGQSREGKPRISDEVIAFLIAVGGKATARDIYYYTNATSQTIKSLEKRDIISITQVEELRIPEVEADEHPEPILLNAEQEKAFQEILALTRPAHMYATDTTAHINNAPDLSRTAQPEPMQPEPKVTLLQGVTGSGKTQIYLKLTEEMLKQGKSVMVLVPEIILTPQIMRKFSRRFGQRVALLHSALSTGERYDQWKRIRRGEVQVVLGTRSAIFAPLENIGLMILDEEQEHSYRSERAPRYHARDIARFLCARNGALLVLGSATPSLETAVLADRHIYRQSVLQHRYNEQAMPQVLISDMREEVKRGYPGIIGADLRRELTKNIQKGEQSILLLNRRGSSRQVLCGECGHVYECPRCSVTLTYHKANQRLICHYCGFSMGLPAQCPRCQGFWKHIGFGTQKAEEELRELFPGVDIMRLDSDTAGGAPEKLLKQFEQENIPILLGTQMVAKGLDFENVTLVGVLSADLSLYSNSYSAAERTFDLLTQVIGRAGRGAKTGRAIIQTYTPENDVIQNAARQNYQSFYHTEMQIRRLRRFPPFADLFSIIVSGPKEDEVLRGAADVRDLLRRLCQDAEMREAAPEVLGPSPMPVVKINNAYRYRCLLVGKNNPATRRRIAWLLRAFVRNKINRGLSIYADCNAPD